MTNTPTNPATSQREKYVEKVRKLLVKAENASTEEEAETFFAKVTELMTKWEIEDAEIRDLDSAPHVVNVERIKMGSYSPQADSLAMQYIANVFDIKVGYKPYRSGDPAMTVLVGREDDLARFHLLWPSLEMQMVRMMKQEEQSWFSRGETRKFRMSYKVGFSERVADRMREARANLVETMALVLVKDDVEEAAANVFTGRSKSVGMKLSPTGLAAGARGGNSADMGQGKIR